MSVCVCAYVYIVYMCTYTHLNFNERGDEGSQRARGWGETEREDGGRERDVSSDKKKRIQTTKKKSLKKNFDANCCHHLPWIPNGAKPT